MTKARNLQTQTKKTTPPSPVIKLKLEQQLILPSFCNLLSVSVLHEDEEVVLDFFYIDKKFKSDKSESPAKLIARIAMTTKHASKFNEILTKLLIKKKK